MTNLETLSSAIDIMSNLEDFFNVEFIAILRWRKIPDAYTRQKTVIVGTNKVNVYTMDDRAIVEIENLGIFQIS